MNRILVPLDGSRLSEAILPMAEALARDYEAELLLLRALRPQRSPEAETDAQEQAERYLAGIAREVEGRGVPGVAWKVWYAEPDRAIADAAAFHDVDLVAMSTHGRGGLSRLLFGSVAESLVRKARVPVLLVRGQLSWQAGSIGRILVPLDGSERSEAVLPVVERLAGPLDFVIDLLHVIEPIPQTAMSELAPRAKEIAELRSEEARGHLAKVAASLEAKGLRARHAVREGPAADAILQYAREVVLGLIAMSTHGRSGWSRLLVGSVAERVLKAAPVPVLLWKAPGPGLNGASGGDRRRAEEE